jgi:N-acetyl-1-D-myo-inositol-2-amino-2-deoxy-alpha-D-glucopyranoside deacetylase
MNKQKTLIFVGAHPDDESFGVGATLAYYAARGVRVYYVCATHGEAGSVSPELMKGYATLAELRSAELACAAETLGLAGVINLGYRDSGMPGWEENKHPRALAMAPLEQVAAQIVEIFRRLKPDVVVTFDPIGGYRHPDHIATHNAAVRAFYAAGDAQQFPEAGPPFQPKKLYYHVFPRRMLKFMFRLLSFFGRDVSKFGRNNDIDLAGMLAVEFPIHAVIRPDKKASQTRNLAIACHASQSGGAPPRRDIFFLANHLFGQRDCFMRAYPAVTGRVRERDLLAGI